MMAVMHRVSDGPVDGVTDVAAGLGHHVPGFATRLGHHMSRLTTGLGDVVSGSAHRVCLRLDGAEGENGGDEDHG